MKSTWGGRQFRQNKPLAVWRGALGGFAPIRRVRLKDWHKNPSPTSASVGVGNEPLPLISVGHSVDNNVHKPKKPRQYWLCGLCPEIDQNPGARLSWPTLFL
jgi:hypothetical protein